MATQQDIAQRENGSASTAQQNALQTPHAQQRSETVIRPPVDIFETSEGITLLADMPGVSRDRLDLRVDGNTLLLEGNVEFEMTEKMEALYADVRSTLYRCSFTLSNELESGKIEANLKEGVLTVRIPKRAELRPRRIEVRGA